MPADGCAALTAAMRHAAAAVVGTEPPAPDHDTVRAMAAGAPRRRRQQVEVLLALASGRHDRTGALAVEHLREFPGDLPVAWAASCVPGFAVRFPRLLECLPPPVSRRQPGVSRPGSTGLVQ